MTPAELERHTCEWCGYQHPVATLPGDVRGEGEGGVSWETSTRRARLPKDWPKRVARVKRRAQGRCEETHHAVGCDRVGREVDHIDQGDDHSLDNLQLLSTACHARKTRIDNGYTATIKAPAEPHPGRRR